tara:strand:- start:26020 stop:27771 length:1752 start_codon:yes stop_codon:yes gene_type:complete
MKDYLEKYIISILLENEMSFDQELLGKSQEHFHKLDFIIKSAVYVYLFIINFLAICFCFSSLEKIDSKQLSNLKKKLFFFNFFIDKIDQALFLIVSIHALGEEKIERLNLEQPPEEKSSTFSKFIVLGSGPTGAVTALELEKKYPGEVLLIEKGYSHSIPQSKHPGDEFIKKWYRGGINSTYFPEMVAYTSGECFGGGSEINSGLYHEPDEEFLLRWGKEFGTKDLNILSLKKHINRVSKLTTKDDTKKTLFSKKFEKGALALSHNYSYLPRFVDSNGKKNSMSKTLLKEYLNLNGKLKLGEEIEKISYEKGKWTLKPLENEMVYSCEKLFLCCGSVFTNNLLIKNKIVKRNKNHLRSFKFHPMIKVIAAYQEELQELNDDVVADQNIEFYPSFIIGNASSSLQFLVTSFQKDKNIKAFILDNWRKMKTFHATFALGKGKIYNIPFLKDPILTYHLSSSDKKTLYEGFNSMLDFVKNTDASYILPIHNKVRFKKVENEYEIGLDQTKNIKGFQLSSVHILGGVTMGENNNCIVDSYGKVFEAEDLYVNDSSLINTPLLKNPQGTVMAIASRNIENFIREYELH